MIDEFLEHCAENTGLEIPEARRISAGILVVLEDNLGDEELHKILRSVPGGEALLASGGGGAGGLGSVTHGFGSMFSGSFSGAPGLAGLRDELGVKGEDVTHVGEEIIKFIRIHSGEHAAHKVRSALPLLHHLS